MNDLTQIKTFVLVMMENRPFDHMLGYLSLPTFSYFCSLPAGTQPNRLMSLSGFSQIEVNQTPLPEQPVLYDWLTARGVKWRVNREGIPFLALMPKWIAPSPSFRSRSASGRTTALSFVLWLRKMSCVKGSALMVRA